MIDQDLAKWIDRRHLTTEALQGISADLVESTARLAVIDNFIEGDRFALLQDVFAGDGKFEPQYKLFSRKQRVSVEEFRSAAEQERFLSHLELVGPSPGRELAKSVLTDLLFRNFLRGKGLDFFSTISKFSVQSVQMINAKILTQNHFLRPHSDATPGRKLCCVFYMNDDWSPDHGGRFELYLDDRKVRTIEPIGNRLLVFQPDTAYCHAVEPFGAASGSWRRGNYSFWIK